MCTVISVRSRSPRRARCAPRGRIATRPELGLPAVYGGVIVAGAFGIIVAPAIGRLGEPALPRKSQARPAIYFRISVIVPAPTVRPPSRIANRSSFSIAMGVMSVTSIPMLSPGITISVPLGSVAVPVTSVVRK